MSQYDRSKPQPPPSLFVRVLAVIFVLPFRLAWDLLCWLGRGVRWLLRPVGRALAWLWTHVVWALLLRPLLIALAFLARWLLAWPAHLLWTYLLWPILKGLGYVLYGLFVVPAQIIWRYLLAPIWTYLFLPVFRAIGWAWRTTGRALAWLGRVFVVAPCALVLHYLLAPVGRAIRAVWRATVVPAARWADVHFVRPLRQAMRELRRGLGLGGGGTRRP